MSDPYLSIIIPTLNAGKTLQMAIDSLVRQLFTDWEILIMDSVSKDDTLAIAQENAGKDERIRVFSEPDKGIYDAMNKGIDRAKGRWLYFLGSDDRFRDDKVLDAVFSSPVVSDPSSPSPDLLYGNVVSSSYKGWYDGKFTLTKLLSRNISHQAIFYKRSLFDLIGQYSLRYRAHADWDLNIRCFADAAIRTRYLDLLVAEFGAEGISSRHDVPFLREVLIPKKLRMLNHQAAPGLGNIRVFDEWWRLMRNAGIRRPEQLDEFANGERIPGTIRMIVGMQSRVSSGLLKNGSLSKSLMFVSYFIHLLLGNVA